MSGGTMNRSRTSSSFRAIVVMTAVLLAGCAEPAATRSPSTVTEADLDILDRAEQVLLRECMGAAGFSYTVSRRVPVPEARDFPYVLDDVVWAGRHGYGSDLRAAAERLRAEEPNRRYFQSLPAERKPAALKAANGERPIGLSVRTPDGMLLSRSDEGCRSAVQRDLYGDLPAWFEAYSVVSALGAIRINRVLKDPRFTEAVVPWSRCMRDAGHDYVSPQAVRAALASLALSADQESKLAVTEAVCASSSGLAATAGALDREHGDALNRAHQSEVDTLARLRLAALPRAQSIAERA
jgi:hypothetical protein